MSKPPAGSYLLTARGWPILGSILLVCLVGGAVAWYRGQMARLETREHLLRQAVAVARTIDPDRVKDLAFSPADLDNPSFQQLREQMTAYAQAAGLRRIYGQALRNGAVVYGPSSVDDQNVPTPLPGTLCQPDSSETSEVFRGGDPFAQASTMGRDNSLRAFAPVTNPRTGDVLMVVGVEMDAAVGGLRPWRQWTAPGIFTVGLGLLLFSGWFLVQLRIRRPAGHSWLNLTEPVLTACFGGLLTLAVSLLLNEREEASRREVFLQVAEGQTAVLKAADWDITDALMVGMAKYLEDDRRILPEEFHYYVGSLVRGADVQALEWVPWVPAQQKEDVEENARGNGLTNFYIFERGQHGECVPVNPRDTYFPVLYAEPLAGNEAVLGFDLGSDPVRRAALFQTRRTGLPTATDPIALTQDSEQQQSLLVFHPVYLREDITDSGWERGKPTPVGFSVAAVRCEALLERALAYSASASRVSRVDWYQLDPKEKTRWLASWPRVRPTHQGQQRIPSPEELESASVMRPLFVFSKAYALVVKPGPAFLAAHPARAALVTGAAGLGLTGVVTVLVGLMCGRRERLEQEVQARTDMLRASEESYRQQFSDNLAVMLLVAPQDGRIVDANKSAERFYGYSHERLLSMSIAQINTLPHDEVARALASVQTQAGAHFEFPHRLADGSTRIVEVYSSLILSRNRPLLHSIIHDITERKSTDARLQQSLSLLQATLESTADGILVVDSAGKITSYNERFVRMWKMSPKMLSVENNGAAITYLLQQFKDPDAFAAKMRHLHDQTQADSFDVVECIYGRVFELFSHPQWVEGRPVGRVWSFRDVTERRQAEAKLEKVHQQLLVSSRQAGMAEVATGMLHNVGNVLNSVNVSATLVSERLKQSKTAKLPLVAELLRQHEADLGDFLVSDPKGRQLPLYLSELAEHLGQEHKTVLEELNSLRENVEHIKNIVAMQQSYAKTGGVIELVNPGEVLEDALRINLSMLQRHQMQVVRQYEPQALPAIHVDKHKVLQILINLIRNATYACDESGRADKCLTLGVSNSADRLSISVRDNGVGIPRENLTRIFNHGFTTRKNGHGFGLHSGALSAREMGGILRGESDGPGHGAAFTLELPAARLSAEPVGQVALPSRS